MGNAQSSGSNIDKHMKILSNQLNRYKGKEHTKNNIVKSILESRLNEKGFVNPHENKNIPEHFKLFAKKRYETSYEKEKTYLNEMIDHNINLLQAYLQTKFQDESKKITFSYELNKLGKFNFLEIDLSLILYFNKILSITDHKSNYKYLSLIQLNDGAHIYFTRKSVIKETFDSNEELFYDIVSQFLSIGIKTIDRHDFEKFIGNLSILIGLKDKLIFKNINEEVTFYKLKIPYEKVEPLYKKWINDGIDIFVHDTDDKYMTHLEFNMSYCPT